jgi:uncharacterized protein
MNTQYNPSTPVMYLMAKPVGSLCNLNCTYCYYLEKEKLYPNDPQKWFMSEKMLEQFIQQYIYSSTVPSVLFTWHGGEPIMRGMEFFNKVVSLQKKYSGGKVIDNSIQTNGTTLTEDWCKFFRDNRFLVGFSIDGPEHCHDMYRVYKSGQPSFYRVMKGLELMHRYNVEFNTLSVVNDYNSHYPLEIYRFLKDIGSHYMQFIPIVEWTDPSAKDDELSILPGQTGKRAVITPWSVKPLDYGNFLIGIFDEWVRKDVGDYFVVPFDCVLANWMRVPPPLCVAAETCGHAGVVEYNGDVYSCDHYVFPEYKLGNIREKNLNTMMGSAEQKRFGLNKRDSLPGYCKKCDYLDLCFGECPKNRIINTPDGEPGLNYLCAGFKKFYTHVEPFFDFMANEIRNERAVSNVRQWAVSKK